MKKYLVILIVFILLSCSEDSINNVISPSSMSSTASIYLNIVLDIMQNNSINRYKIEWVSFREKTIKYAGNAQTKKATYDAIRFAINNLGDHHSLFIEPPTNLIAMPIIQSENKTTLSLIKSNTQLLGVRINENIGFIRIPYFNGTGELEINFANDIQSLIKSLDSTSIKGWIVDLRQNIGGNMWPMLAGVGPILGEGLVGKFVDPDTNISNWYYQDGKSLLENIIWTQVNNPYYLIYSNPYVAVLTDGFTASSGEAIVVAFRERQNTKSFGDYTWGVSTANDVYTLSDGAMLVLTVSTMADRNGNLYGNKIKPNEIVLGPFKENPLDNDTVVNVAVNWLKSNF